MVSGLCSTTAASHSGREGTKRNIMVVIIGR
jgi:hypothetical protein